ncbi:MAG: glutaredoxin family protein [Rhodocyclaceae bacterium]|nr:glutaredoxin family protein [Rhodocyclaceae bacterium]MDZ4214686.1 glutaredoxin family protein [Rhodocyclaceae bacterium]
MKAIVWLSAILCASLVQAQTAYRWVDQDGKVHYSDRAPPKTAREVQERKLNAPAAAKELPYAVRQAANNFPVTLYVSPDCGTRCKEGRDYLNKRSIPFSETTVATNEDVEALRKLLGGSDPSVPILTVGSKVSRGYLQTDWAGLLDAAGYPKSP